MTREEQIEQAAKAFDIQIISTPLTLFEKGAEWADSHPHWISVEDELPEYDQKVLWCWDDGLISIGRVALDEQHIEAGYITHWMPMPEAPKKGEEK